jgi:hypothetical protein
MNHSLNKSISLHSSSEASPQERPTILTPQKIMNPSHNKSNSLHPRNGGDPQGLKINPRLPPRSLEIESFACS